MLSVSPLTEFSTCYASVRRSRPSLKLHSRQSFVSWTCRIRPAGESRYCTRLRTAWCVGCLLTWCLPDRLARARSLSEPAIAAKHAHNVPSRRAVGSGTPATPPVQARIRPSVSTVAQSLNTTGNTDGADASVAAITGMQAVSGDSNNISSRSLPERTRSKRGHRPVGESVSIEPVRVVSLQQLRQAMP